MNLFNVVVDAFIMHWLENFVEEGVGPEVFDLSVQHMATLFYTYNYLLVSLRP